MKYYAQILGIILLLETIESQQPITETIESQQPITKSMKFLAPVFDCQIHSWGDTVACYKTELYQSSHDYLPLPLDEIPNPEKIETIDIAVPARMLSEPPLNHAEASYDNAWLIQDAKMFHRFPNLKTIILDKFYARIDQKFWQDDNLKSELLRELFNLPILTEIEMSDAMELEFEFPISLKRLTCVSCFRFNFNLSLNFNLSYINLSFTRLKKMPELSQPPPPLEEIALEGVDLEGIQFSILDIAQICKLENLILELFVGMHIDDRRKYCECLTLQKFSRDYNVRIPRMDSKCDAFIRKENFIEEEECFEYSYEEVRMKRQEACRDAPSNKSSPISNILLLIIGFLLVFLLLFVSIVLL